MSVSIKPKILNVYDENGNEIQIPAIQGKDGEPGPTPQKGVDYFTEEDKNELVDSVINKLPTWDGGAF